jgi:tetratricopeptide (TPR) repeat protein
MKYAVAALLAAVSGLVLFAIPSLAQRPTAEKELDQGVKAYKEARYDDAITHFKLAVEADPNLLNARMYLATSYAQKYIPGAETVENTHLSNLAIEQYKNIIESKDPVPSRAQLINSTKGVAGLYLQMKKFDEARRYYKKAVEIDPTDPENYYDIGVIDWTKSFQPRAELRAELKMKLEDSLIHNPACWQLKSQNETVVRDGIEQLSEAIKLRPDYNDAMAYLNLMLRERADIQCGDHNAYNADVNAADHWVDLMMETVTSKRLKAGATVAELK